MPRKNQRLRVWRGEIRKTTGGLTKDMLMRNKKGKVVSKRKSIAASKANNLGNWLRSKGDTFADRPAGAQRGVKKQNAKKEKAVDLTASPKKKKKLDSKKTVNLLKKATKAGKKMAKSSKPKPKSEPKQKKIDVVDLSTFQAPKKKKAEPAPDLGDLLGGFDW